MQLQCIQFESFFFSQIWKRFATVTLQCYLIKNRQSCRLDYVSFQTEKNPHISSYNMNYKNFNTQFTFYVGISYVLRFYTLSCLLNIHVYGNWGKRLFKKT